MKCYDINRAQELAAQNNVFSFGERGAGRKHFEDSFKFGVKGRGKSRKAKMQLAEISLSQMTKDEDVIVIDPESVEKTKSSH